MPTVVWFCLLVLLAVPAGCADLEWNWRATGEGLLRSACHAMGSCEVTDGRLVP